MATSYYHDFLTDQRHEPASGLYYYENYVYRQDVNGGVDVGYDVGKETFLVLGYRYGQQDQGELLGERSPYNSKYHRILAGVEGSPVKWLKLNVPARPGIPPLRPRHTHHFWPERIAVLRRCFRHGLPTKADTVTFRWTRYEQPAFSSQSVYEDIKYDLPWRHKFCDQFTAGAGFTALCGRLADAGEP